MTTLVTGVVGFIGSHLGALLLEGDEKVVVLDNFNDYYDPALKRANAERLSQHANATIIEGDICDEALVNELFQKHGITRVAHLAAMAGVRESVEQTPLYMQVNAIGTMNLLEAARRTDLEVFVFGSTGSVYGRSQQIPFREDDNADRPLASYPASKRSAELLAYSYHNLFKMNITVLRFFNVYGPAGRPDMMPLRILHAIHDGTSLPIFNDGDIHRDWTYISDTVDGVASALTRPMGYEIINLGLGQPVSLNAFIDVIESLTGKKLNRTPTPTPSSDPPITYCDNTKARELLGYAPHIPVEEGLRNTWEWFRKTFDV